MGRGQQTDCSAPNSRRKVIFVDHSGYASVLFLLLRFAGSNTDATPEEKINYLSFCLTLFLPVYFWCF